MKVVVLAGGTSTERDVSLITGSGIYKALKQNGHQVILLDVYLGYEGETEDIFAKEYDWTENISAISEQNPDLEKIKAMRPDGDKNFFGPNVLALCKEADAVFMALHGANGEDGKIQACFELMGIPFTGTDFVSAAMAMDKGITKDLFKAYSIFNSSLIFSDISFKDRSLYPITLKKNTSGRCIFLKQDMALEMCFFLVSYSFFVVGIFRFALTKEYNASSIKSISKDE